ncbi:metallophosphoesterase [Prochlorococcus sp. AH-736-L23]|nr:metallophosphoesterase [Prochlorococcus sp. AH-736-L23]
MKSKFAFFLLGFTSSIILFLITFLLVGKVRLRNYYYFLNSTLRKSFVSQSKFKEYDFSTCLPQKISYVPDQSSVVIGHAYGRGQSKINRKNLNPKVDRFLLENKNKIDTLFLTGDVFNIPSLAKWEYLYEKYEEYFDIYIAPGNHDVDFPYGDLFKLYISKKQPINFPFILKKSGFNIVVDDSNLPKTLFDFEDNIEKFNVLNGDVIFLRHHVLIDKLSSFGGSNKKLLKKQIFEKLLKNNSNIYFVYGNGGMYANKPRIACFEHKNITHLLNGIGDFNDDLILILNKNKIYSYNIGN